MIIVMLLFEAFTDVNSYFSVAHLSIMDRSLGGRCSELHIETPLYPLDSWQCPALFSDRANAQYLIFP